MNDLHQEHLDPYRVFFEHSMDALLLATPEGIILRANRAACDMFACTEQDLCRNGLEGILDESDSRLAAALEERSHTGKIRSELTLVRRDGTKFDGDLSSELFEGADGNRRSNIIIRDVSPHRQALQALRESESKMKSIFLAAPVGIGMVIHRVFKEVNSKFCEITGYDTSELIGQSARIIYPSDEEYEYVGRAKYGMIQKHVTGSVETRFKRKDGVIVNVLMSSTPLDPADLSAGVTFTALDITEQKRAEEALFESEKRFRNLAEMLPQTVFESDTDLNLTFVNRKGYELFGYSKEDFEKGLNGYNTLAPEERERARKNVGKRLRGDLFGTNEYRGLRKDGTTFPALLDTCPIITDGNVIGLRGIIIDLTENKKIENQLRQAQKMESISRLAGGVAHDFNNMLGVIIGNAEVALEQVAASDDLFFNLEEIRKAAERSAGLTRQLLGFARKQFFAPEVLDLNQMTDEILKLLKGDMIFKNLQLYFLPDSNLWQVKADPSQIGRILSSLCINACDAASSRITIRIENMIIDQAFCSCHHGISPGDFVRISVTDDGRGIDKETCDHVFEPFFTTKDLSEGAGLGLSMAYGIVKQNGGFIYIDSEPGKGTAVQIFFPRHMV